MKCLLGISNFLEEISRLSYLLFSSISLYWSLRKACLSLLAILWNSAFKRGDLSFSPLLSLLFFSQLFVRPPQTAILLFHLSLAIANSQNVNCRWAGTLFLFTDVSPALRIPSGPEKALDKQIFQKWHLSWTVTNKMGFNRWEMGEGIF